MMLRMSAVLALWFIWLGFVIVAAKLRARATSR